VTIAIIAAIVLTATTAVGAARLHVKSGLQMRLLGRGMNLSDLETLSTEELGVLLERLERETAPEPVMGAMCYAAAMYPEVAEYVCPVCGEKTLYTDYNTEFVEWELQGCRRLFGEIEAVVEMEIELDETQFCQYCSGGEIESPMLVLRITRDDGTVISNPVGQLDLMLLESFVKGRLFYYTWNDGQEPLRPHVDRIATLLGIEADTP
jgi:hypothetical protein